MAIIRSLAIGKARKSAGNLTFATIKGRTIAREKPAFVSNPNTAKQQAQRSKMSKVVAAYRSIGSQLKDLFTVVPPYGSAYNQFVKSNIGIADNFEIDEATGVVKNITGMCIANGVYPSGCFTFLSDDNDAFINVVNPQLQAEIKAGDMLFVVGTPSEGDGTPRIYSHVLTEANVEAIKSQSNYIPIPDVHHPSNVAVAWYSPATNRSTTAYVAVYEDTETNP